MVTAIILAGGVGSRVGTGRPKQFIEVLGKPVLAYTIEIFQNNPQIDAIEVVCHKKWKEYLMGMIEQYGLSKVKWIADGGVQGGSVKIQAQKEEGQRRRKAGRSRVKETGSTGKEGRKVKVE